MYDVVIIGAGAAGLTAAIYTARARLKTLVLETYTPPSQAVVTSEIENYPGFPDGLNGFELIDRFKKQAGKFGAEFKTEEVKSLEQIEFDNKNIWKIKTVAEELDSLCVIVASGARPNKLGIPGEDRFCGKGVSYCATCDGALFKGKHVAVVGGGDTAVEEALFLTKFASKVSIIHRRDRLRATEILQERAFANKRIEYIWNSVVEKICGENSVKALRVRNVKTDRVTDFACDGVFIFVGYTPNTDFLKGILKLDKDGYIIADADMKTEKQGLFAAGDARKKLLRQIVTASGDGATAGFCAEQYVAELKGKAYK